MAARTRDKKNQETRKATQFARLKPEMVKWLKDYCDEHGYAQNRVLEKLLEYFRSLEELDRKQVVEGTNVVPAFSLLMERLEWSNHSFAKTFWPWSLEEFQEVERLATKLNATGVAWLARYKASYCWLDIGMFWRNQALEQNAPNDFRRASIAIQNALVLCQNHLEHALHRVMFFNLACSWSLLARFEIEEKLLRVKSRYVGVLRKDTDNAWESIGTTWRDEISDKTFAARIKTYGDKAMESFQQVVTSGVVPKDYGFLLRSASSDADLLFLRTDEAYRHDFTRFVQGSLLTHSVGGAFDLLASSISEKNREKVFGWSLPKQQGA